MVIVEYKSMGKFWIIIKSLTLVQLSRGLSASSRRKVLYDSLAVGSLFIYPESSEAARGAAELDFEFYIRDLVGGNRKEGNIQASPPPKVAPPRILEGPLLPLLLNERCTMECLPVLALVQQVQKSTGKDSYIIEKTIQDQVKEIRDRATKSFYARAPWQTESVSDQYYFDLTCYALWRTAALLLPNYSDRDAFMRQLGRILLEKIIALNLISQPIPAKNSATSTILPMNDLLSVFKKSNYCKSYRIAEEQKAGSNSPPAFDELDDEAIRDGTSVDCLVSLFEPVTLGASLQITGEQSRFAPDFIGPTLAALWERASIRSSWDTFFVDQEYRPNPKDYFPNEVLLQFTLTKV